MRRGCAPAPGCVCSCSYEASADSITSRSASVVQCRFFAVSAARSAASPPSSSSSANRSVRPRSRCLAGLCCTVQNGHTSKLRCAASLSGRRSPRRPHPMWHPRSQRCGRSGKARRQGALRLPQQVRPGTATSRSGCPFSKQLPPPGTPPCAPWHLGGCGVQAGVQARFLSCVFKRPFLDIQRRHCSAHKKPPSSEFEEQPLHTRSLSAP